MWKSSLWHNVTWYIQSITFTRHCISFVRRVCVCILKKVFQCFSIFLSFFFASLSPFLRLPFFSSMSWLAKKKKRQKIKIRKPKAVAVCVRIIHISRYLPLASAIITWMWLCITFTFSYWSLALLMNARSNFQSYTKLYNCAPFAPAPAVRTRARLFVRSA